jgi:G3E family GTPase
MSSLAVPDRPAPQDIVSFCMQIDEPIGWQEFTIWFTMLLNRHGDKILRVKGLLSIAGCAQPAVLHAVQHLVYPVLHLDAWPDAQRRSNSSLSRRGSHARASKRHMRGFVNASKNLIIEHSPR